MTDRIALTPVAIAEGHSLADSLFGGRPRQVSHHNVPSAVFTQPPIGSVGMTEDQAAEAFLVSFASQARPSSGLT